MQQQKPTKCSASNKTRYEDKGEAKDALVRLKATGRRYDFITGKRVNRRKGKVAQSRVYWCPLCRGYHLTSNNAPLGQHRLATNISENRKRSADVVKDKQEAADWKKDSLPFPNLENQNQ